MLGRVVIAASAFGLLLTSFEAHPAPPQAPAAPQQAPAFRGEVNVIRLDVSVLDRNRHPVRGLTAADFSVTEDGKAQPVVAATEIRAAEQDPKLAAWMQYTPRDVASNDLVEQLGEGRAFAIVLDDWSIPFDSIDAIMSARELARHVVDQLGPSDLAAVILPQASGRGQDFTGDRGKLRAAIDRFEPTEILWMDPTIQGTRDKGGADMPFRYSSALARTTCLRARPLVPTLEAVTSKLATIPNRRKTVVLVSFGVPMSFDPSSGGCDGILSGIMQGIFRKALEANINIYGVVPGDERGADDQVRNSVMRSMRTPTPVNALRTGYLKFLETVAGNTGARALLRGDIWGGLDEMLAEAGSYYLVGYQTSNGRPDGKFRKVQVKVNRIGLIVRARSGYYGRLEGTLETPTAGTSTHDLALAGLTPDAALPLRAIATPLGRVGASNQSDVAVVLTVRLPAPRGPVVETLTLIRNLYDAGGTPGPPVQETRRVTLVPTEGDYLRYDTLQRLTLTPGHYQLRLNATSTAIGASASVHTDLEVPDFSRLPVKVSGVVFGAKPAAGAVRDDPFADILPIVPTTARDFARGGEIIAFFRIFQGGTGPLGPLTMTSQVVGVQGQAVSTTTRALPAEAFDPATRGAEVELPLPLSDLTPGPYLLSIGATGTGGASDRVDLRFSVR